MKNEGHGIQAALRTALSNSNGQLVSRMDADDIMPKSKLQALKQTLEDAGLRHVAVGRVEYFSSDKDLGEGYKKYASWINDQLSSSQPFKEIYKECPIPSPNWMMFKSDLRAIGGFERDIYPEDYDLAFRMYAHGLKVQACDQVTHLWRDHPIRTSRISEVYRQNHFMSLKVKHWCAIEWDQAYTTLLWGAGQKGKAAAKALIDCDVPFVWATENPNKIGHIIYDQPLIRLPEMGESRNYQVLVAISGPDDQRQIRERLKAHHQHKVFYLC